jgi:hypothetical protein
LRNEQVAHSPEANSRFVRTLRERMDAVIDRLDTRAEGQASDDLDATTFTEPLPSENGERSVDGTSSQVPGE